MVYVQTPIQLYLFTFSKSFTLGAAQSAPGGYLRDTNWPGATSCAMSGDTQFTAPEVALIYMSGNLILLVPMISYTSYMIR